MRYSNITRLISASPFSNGLSNTMQEELAAWLDDAGYTLDNMNIDDIIVNGLTCVDEEEYLNSDYDCEERLFFQDGEDYWLWN